MASEIFARTKARKSKKAAKTDHGIYRQHLTPDEQAWYDKLELGAVDHELRLTRIRLARALAAEASAADAPETEPAPAKKTKADDHTAIIDRLIGRIEGLERTRRLLGGHGGDNDAIDGFEAVPYDDTP